MKKYNKLRTEWFQVIKVYVKTKIKFNEIEYVHDNIMKNNIQNCKSKWIHSFKNYIVLYLDFLKTKWVGSK